MAIRPIREEETADVLVVVEVQVEMLVQIKALAKKNTLAYLKIQESAKELHLGNFHKTHINHSKVPASHLIRISTLKGVISLLSTVILKISKINDFINNASRINKSIIKLFTI